MDRSLKDKEGGYDRGKLCQQLHGRHTHAVVDWEKEVFCVFFSVGAAIFESVAQPVLGATFHISQQEPLSSDAGRRQHNQTHNLGTSIPGHPSSVIQFQFLFYLIYLSFSLDSLLWLIILRLGSARSALNVFKNLRIVLFSFPKAKTMKKGIKFSLWNVFIFECD